MILTLPFPPSVNTYWRAPTKGPLAGRHMISERGRDYRRNAVIAVFEQLRRVPTPQRGLLAVDIVLYPPDKTRRDLDNYLKAPFDALTYANIWLDDSQVQMFSVRWGDICRPGRIELAIQEFAPGCEK